MPSDFPDDTDVFPSAATLAAHTLATDPHSTLHGNLGDAVTAVEDWLRSHLTDVADSRILGNNTGAAGAPVQLTAAQVRTLLSLGTAALVNTSAFDPAGSAAAAQAASQPLDADLTALAALSGTGVIYYRSAANTWTAVTIGTNLTFVGGTLAAAGSSPGGSDTQIQFNDAGTFGGDAQLTFNKTSGLTTVTSNAADGAALAKFLPGSGASYTQINNNGTVVIDADVITGTWPLTVKYNGTTTATVHCTGVVTGTKLASTNVNDVCVDIGAGNAEFKTTGNTQPVQLNTFNELHIRPGALGGVGTRRVSVISQAAADVPLVIKGAASQSANWQEWQNSSAEVGAGLSIGALTGSTGSGGRLALYRADSPLQATTYGWNSLVCGSNIAYTMTYTTGLSIDGDTSWGDSSVIQAHRPGSAGGRFKVSAASSGGNVGIWNNSPTAQLDVTCNAAGIVGLIVKGATSQSANLQEWQNNSSTVLASINSAGAVYTPQVNDSNGNEVLKFTTTSSAVNELTLANAATGGDPTLSATGDDTDINIRLLPKGAGYLIVPAGALATPGITFDSRDNPPNSTGFYGFGFDIFAVTNGTLVFSFNNSTGNTSNVDLGMPNGCLSSGGVFRWSNDSGNPHQTKDTGLKRAVAGVIATTDGSSGTGWLQNSAARSRLVSNVTNDTVTPSNLTELSLTLKAGRKYTGRLTLRVSNSTAADGLLLDFDGGSATMTSFAAGIVANVQGATLGTTVSTALATDLTATALNGTGDNWIEVAISLVCNGAGTLIPRAAMNADTGGTLTVALGSYLWLEDMPA